MKTFKRILFIVFAALALQPLGNSASAEFRFEPVITVSEEYTDNVFLTPQNPTEDYITRVLPSVLFVYRAPLWEWTLAYAYDYRYYARDSRSNDSTQAIGFSNHTSLARDRYFLDVRDDYRRVSLDVSRDFTRQSLFVNQTDSNEFSITPYARLNLTSQTTGTAGYLYRNLWYQERNSIDKSDHTLYLDLVDELSLRTVLNASLWHTWTDARTLSYNRTDFFGGPKHEYAEGSTIWFILGASRFSTEESQKATQPYWDAGITHRFVSYTLTLNAALTYLDDPRQVQRREDRYVATLRKDTERLGLGFTAGLYEYRDFLTKHLQNTRYGVGGSLGYRITSALRGSYSLDIDRYENNVTDTYSILYLNAAKLEYQFPSSTTIALDYRFAHGYSPDLVNYGMNYDNNRVIVELKKQF